jgi:hypothetical protein
MRTPRFFFTEKAPAGDGGMIPYFRPCMPGMSVHFEWVTDHVQYVTVPHSTWRKLRLATTLAATSLIT